MSIPRQLHQIWLGPDPVPERLREYAASWRRYCPHWVLVLWTDRPEEHADLAAGPWHQVAEPPPIINRWAYHWAPRWFGPRAAWAARSDILRMELVARYGGVYADLDVELFGPVEDLLSGVRLFIAEEWGPCAGNYLFGATPNHPALWSAVRDLWRGLAPELAPRGLIGRTLLRLKGTPVRAYNRFDETPPPAAWKPILQTTGPFYLNGKLAAHPDCVVFPWQLFNPLPAPMDPAKVRNWPDSAVGNHHYAGSWYDRDKTAPPAALREKSP